MNEELHMTQEQFDVADLEKAADNHSFEETCKRLRENEINRKNEGVFGWQSKKSFIAGAKWQKNALLKWANDKLSFCKQMILDGEPGFEYKLSIYEQLIDKLNML